MQRHQYIQDIYMYIIICIYTYISVLDAVNNVFFPTNWGCSVGFPHQRRLGAAWDLLMRGEGIELPREQALMEPQREMTCLGWAKKKLRVKRRNKKTHAYFGMIYKYTKLIIMEKMGVVTLLGTNISPEKPILKMVFLFPRWDMLIPQRVYQTSLESFIGLLVPVGCLGFKSSNQATEAWKEVGEDTTSTRCRCWWLCWESHLNLKNLEMNG